MPVTSAQFEWLEQLWIGRSGTLRTRRGFIAIQSITSRSDVMRGTPESLETIESVLRKAGVEFIDENGGGPGVRLRHRQQKKR